MKTGPKLLALFLALSFVTSSAFAGSAQAEELHPTEATEDCAGPIWFDTLTAGFYYCTAHVKDTSTTGATAPTGEVLTKGGHLCTLVPTGPAEGSCGESAGAYPNSPYTRTIEYSGDAEHLTSSYSHLISPGSPGNPNEEPPAGGGQSAGGSSGGPNYTVPITTRAPRTRISHRPSKRTASRVARFVFVGSAQRECRLDGGSWVTCGVKFSHAVSKGRHTLRVRTVGSSGQSASPTTVFSWRVLAKG